METRANNRGQYTEDNLNSLSSQEETENCDSKIWIFGTVGIIAFWYFVLPKLLNK